ncbi:hypothetical protein D918_09615 [Trichuris suis]|nr:hypothetical protein D918_09615 [Trichuris suis]
MRSLWKKFPFSGSDDQEDIISEGSICVYLHNFTMFSVLFSFGSIMSICSVRQSMVFNVST